MLRSENNSLRAAEVLREVLNERTKRNPAYSLRAMARDLDVTAGYLSLLLSGKRKLSFQRAVHFCKLLALDDVRSDWLLRAVAIESSNNRACRDFLEKSLSGTSGPIQSSEFAILEIDRFKMLSEWYHIAILDLTLVSAFRPDPDWVAQQLGITPLEVKNAVARLERLGLLEIDGDHWKKTNAKLVIPTTHSDRAIRRFHGQMMDKAKEVLEAGNEAEFHLREINGSTMAINPHRIPEARRRIQRFRREMLEFLTSGDCTELYQLNTQFFRLTKDTLDSQSRSKGERT